MPYFVTVDAVFIQVSLALAALFPKHLPGLLEYQSLISQLAANALPVSKRIVVSCFGHWGTL